MASVEPVYSVSAASSAAFAGPSAAAASSSELQLPFAPRPKPSARPIAREPEDLESTFLLGVSPQLPRSDSFELAVIEFDREFERAILKARVAGEFEALVPRLLLPAANHPSLDSSNPTWTPVARIGRALRAGISARRVLSGQFSKQAQSPHLPFKNKIYVCLRCEQGDLGWWTGDYTVYRTCISDTRSAERGLQECSISHAFPTLAEAEAFLRGAGRQWPRELLSVQDL